MLACLGLTLLPQLKRSTQCQCQIDWLLARCLMKKGFLVLNLEITLRTPQDTRPSEQIAKNHTQKVAPQLHKYFLE
ncbi:hypothetical protein HpNP114_08440 [Helicobacter pylori]